MAQVTASNIAPQTEKLTVTVDTNDYLPEYQKKLKDIAKQANIPGFRKGMVPAGVVKKMYGESLFNEAVFASFDKTLNDYLQKEKPDTFLQPILEDDQSMNFDVNHPQEYTLNFDVATRPAVQLPDLSKAGLTYYKVDVTDDMVNDETEKMQYRSGGTKEAATITTKDDSFTGSFLLQTQADEAVVEPTELKVSVQDFNDDTQNQLIGKGLGDEISGTPDSLFASNSKATLMKQLGLDSTNETDGEKQYTITILDIQTPVKDELGEDFYTKVYPGKHITDEATFKTTLKEEIQNYWDKQSKNQYDDQIYHYLMDNSTVSLPTDFIKRWLTYNNGKPISEQEAEQKLPKTENQLKWTLISDEIIKENDFKVTPDDLRSYFKNEVQQYFGNMSLGDGGENDWVDSYVDRLMKDQKQVTRAAESIITNKVFEWAEQQSKPSEQEKPVSEKELTDMIQNHHH